MNQQSFERALHKWEPWLNSIKSARKEFSSSDLHPPLEEMRSAAKKALKELQFPECTLLEVYWLCCVFSDYDTETGFKFEELKLPDWFPLPFGFKKEEQLNKQVLDLKGGRIKPPIIWDEADVNFWQMSDPIFQITGDIPDYILNTDFIVLLPPDHPVHAYVSKGRPRKTSPDGELRMPHLDMKPEELIKESQLIPAAPLPRPKCNHCGSLSLMWDNQQEKFKCLLCSRTTPLHQG